MLCYKFLFVRHSIVGLQMALWHCWPNIVNFFQFPYYSCIVFLELTFHLGGDRGRRGTQCMPFQSPKYQPTSVTRIVYGNDVEARARICRSRKCVIVSMSILLNRMIHWFSLTSRRNANYYFLAYHNSFKFRAASTQ